jgi:hypothetical protein
MPRARSSSHRAHLILITGADLGTTGQVCEAWPVGPLKSAPLLHRTVPRLPRRPPHLVFSEKCGVISLTPSAGEDRLISCPQHIRAVGRSRCLWSNHICHMIWGFAALYPLGLTFGQSSRVVNRCVFGYLHIRCLPRTLEMDYTDKYRERQHTVRSYCDRLCRICRSTGKRRFRLPTSLPSHPERTHVWPDSLPSRRHRL